MKIKVIHFAEGKYIIRYKKRFFWTRLEYTWHLGNMISTTQPMMFSDYEGAVEYASNLTWEKIKNHNKRQAEIYKELIKKSNDIENERNSKYKVMEIK